MPQGGILARYPHLKDTLKPAPKRDVWRIKGRTLEPEVGEDFEPIEDEDIPIGEDFEPIEEEPKLNVERPEPGWVPMKDRKPIDPTVIEGKTEEPKELSTWDKVWEPTTTFPSKVANRITGTEGNNPYSMQNMRKNIESSEEGDLNHRLAKVLGFYEGAVEGTGNTLSQMSALGDAIPMALGFGAWGAGARGLKNIAKALNWGERATSWPASIHGAQTIMDPETSWADKAFGVAEMAGGAAGTIAPTPTIRPRAGVNPNIADAAKRPVAETITDDLMDNLDLETGQAVRPEEKTITVEKVDIETLEQLEEAGYQFSGNDAQGRATFTLGDTTRPVETPTPTPERPLPLTDRPRPHGFFDDVNQDPNFFRDKRPPLDESYRNTELGFEAERRYPVDSLENLKTRFGESLNRDAGLFDESAINTRLDEQANQRYPQDSVENIENRLRQSIDRDTDPGFFKEPMPEDLFGDNASFSKTEDPNRFTQPEVRPRPLARSSLGNIGEAITNTPDIGMQPNPQGPLPPEFDFGGRMETNLRNSVPDRPAGLFDEPAPRNSLDQLGDDVSRMADNPVTKKAAQEADDYLKFHLGNEEDIIDIFRNTYKGEVPMVAGKELIQNSIDAVMHNPEGHVNVDISESGKTVRVTDNGPGLTLDELKTVFTALASSGKRGLGNTIGEMGAGKTTYLLTGQNVRVTTTAREANGSLMNYVFEGTPEDFIKGRVKVDKAQVLDTTQTGTDIVLKVTDDQKFDKLQSYVKNLEKYSNVPAKISVTGARRLSWHEANTPDWTESFEIAARKAAEGGKLIYESESGSSKYKITQPADAILSERDNIALILVNRGMFQGVDTVYTSKARLPDRLVVELDPKVTAKDPDYPLTVPTRESLRGTTKGDINEAIMKELVEGEAKKRQEELGRIFQQMMTPRPGHNTVVVDSMGVYTPDEITTIANNPQLTQALDILKTRIVDLFKSQFAYSSEIVSFGLILDPKVRGVNVRNPANHNQNAILLNPIAILTDNTPNKGANSLVHITLHELTHAIERTEGAGFTSTFANIYNSFDLEIQANVKSKLLPLLGDVNRRYHPEIQEILRIGQEARGREGAKKHTLIAEEGSDVSRIGRQNETISTTRPDGEGTSKRIAVKGVAAARQAVSRGYEIKGILPDGRIEMTYTGKKSDVPVLESEIGSKRVRPRDANAQLGKLTDMKKESAWLEAYNLPRGIMAAWDASAPFRQGLGVIHEKAFWKNLAPMFRAMRSEDAFQIIQKSIEDRPMFRPRKNPKYNPLKKDSKKFLPSFAEEAGLALTDLTQLSRREEAIMSTWAEKFPFVRASNRAYTAFLNKTRADVFERLVKNSEAIDPGDAFGANAKVNVPLVREFAQFVNTATGRGSLGSLEKHADILNKGLFSPRLIASRVRMLNPATYVMASPMVRKEYLKSAIAMVMTGTMVNELLSFSGASEPVERDPRSTDFGKIKIGETRFDPYGGLQQYIVKAVQSMIYVSNQVRDAGSLMAPGMQDEVNRPIPEVKSSTTGNQYQLGEKWGARDAFENLLDFGIGKSHPAANFLIHFMKGKTLDGRPFYLSQEIANRFIPIIAQDIMELTTENPEWFKDTFDYAMSGGDVGQLPSIEAPEKAALAIPEFFGVSMQNYGRPSKLW